MTAGGDDAEVDSGVLHRWRLGNGLRSRCRVLRLSLCVSTAAGDGSSRCRREQRGCRPRDVHSCQPVGLDSITREGSVTVYEKLGVPRRGLQGRAGTGISRLSRAAPAGPRVRGCQGNDVYRSRQIARLQRQPELSHSRRRGPGQLSERGHLVRRVRRPDLTPPIWLTRHDRDRPASGDSVIENKGVPAAP